ncbi:Dual specificity protein phosphatase 8 [Halotydeus destructor]|nr:Dual specificity protein phosphatase 8 [Halotydeus destructor]
MDILQSTKVTVNCSVKLIDAHQLSCIVQNRSDNVLIVDGRSFLEYNTSCIRYAISVCSSKIIKRRLQQDKVSVKELLRPSCQYDILGNATDIIVYDQGFLDYKSLPQDSFGHVLLVKLSQSFSNVQYLSGGFVQFQATYPHLCEDKKRSSTLTVLSQPCLSMASQGPTKILPFLYLGSQNDSMNKQLLRDLNITYELNVSNSCPKSEFVAEASFLRIPVNDNYTEKLLPHFPKAFHFLDLVRESSGCALVHCLAGISRSATIAIAYVMKHLGLSCDDAYRYVKSKRPSISPNFNFLGQLLEYEKQLVSLRAETSMKPKMIVDRDAKVQPKQCCAMLQSDTSNSLRCPSSPVASAAATASCSASSSSPAASLSAAQCQPRVEVHISPEALTVTATPFKSATSSLC